MSQHSAGIRLRQTVKESNPLIVVGYANAYPARLATQSDFEAIYLSGGDTAVCFCGIPDLGIITMEDVLIDTRCIMDGVDTSLLVDIDVGWDGAFNIARIIRSFEHAGVVAVHIGDQVTQKCCNHRPSKAIVSKDEMADHIKAAVDACVDENSVVMARTDALVIEGLDATIERAQACVETGADMIFLEAMTDLKMYCQFVDVVKVPVLANITEFGATSFYTQSELVENGVPLVLYPLSPFRAASKAALNVYETIMRDDAQMAVAGTIQIHAKPYGHLDYHALEQRLDKLFQKRFTTFRWSFNKSASAV